MARRRSRARENPTTTQWLIGAGVVAALGVGAYLLYSKSAAAAPALPAPAPAPSPPPAPTAPASGPKAYSFSTNNSGGHVTLHPGDTVSFSFPNDPNAATSVLNDWFWTSSPDLGYNGRSLSTSSTGQLVETDTFTYTGGGGSQMDIAAQLLPTTGPARATSGPNPPSSAPRPGASTFQFTIVTTG